MMLFVLQAEKGNYPALGMHRYAHKRSIRLQYAEVRNFIVEATVQILSRAIMRS